jgi:hypothetical protein
VRIVIRIWIMLHTDGEVSDETDADVLAQSVENSHLPKYTKFSLMPLMLAHAVTVLACARKVPGSYDGWNIDKPDCLGVFPQCLSTNGPPMWSSGQSFCLQIQRFQVRFQALPDFLRSRGSGTGSTQPRDCN